jgi:Zn2+/Cd2+-exporting ATPase
MISAITAAAGNGVLVKGGKYIESLATIRTFVFDKTGTLTTGKLEVTEVVSFSPSSKEVLRLAASLETMSEHPVARAIVEKARAEELTLGPVIGFSSIRGQGVKGTVDGKDVTVGKQEFFQKIPEEVLNKTRELQSQGQTTVMLGVENDIVGIVALKDKGRADAARTIEELRTRGVQSTIISGDNEETTAAFAKTVGVEHYHAELLPEAKLEEVAHLTKEYGSVAMIGDGVNDAPALAKANVGIVMGVLGSDVSIETADVALMRDDLSKLPYVLDLSRSTRRVVKENITASILVKAVFALLALPGLVTLALAVGVGDMGLSLAVILNAMRLRFVQ